MARRFIVAALAVGTAVGMTALASAQSGSGAGSAEGGMKSPTVGSPTDKRDIPDAGKGGTTGQGASPYAPGHNPGEPNPGQGGTPPGHQMKEPDKTDPTIKQDD